jgi:hypothetical protein
MASVFKMTNIGRKIVMIFLSFSGLVVAASLIYVLKDLVLIAGITYGTPSSRETASCYLGKTMIVDFGLVKCTLNSKDEAVRYYAIKAMNVASVGWHREYALNAVKQRIGIESDDLCKKEIGLFLLRCNERKVAYRVLSTCDKLNTDERAILTHLAKEFGDSSRAVR